jgi:pimeloyl-ACP methyl ester carboxylesterase
VAEADTSESPQAASPDEPTRKRRSRWRRVLTILGGIVGVLIVLIVVVLWATLPDDPGDFYDAPANVPPTPGELLRSEPFTRDVPAGARGWRILYTTTRGDGTPAIASAIVVAPDVPFTDPRPVIAWAHGTTGVAEGCAPSILDNPFENLPALDAIVANGWILVATDYVGLGTAGPHPYLVGQDEARSTLDSVRAARQLGAISMTDQTVVWGHSQGGHAALWTGILAPEYAADVPLDGVAAFAPASDLPALLDEVQDTLPGRIISSYVLTAWSEIYDEVTFDEVVRPGARLLTRGIARRCLSGRAALVPAVQAAILRGTIVAIDPTTGPMADLLAANTPDRPIDAPLLIAQGESDGLILPGVQDAFVERRCAAGQSLLYLTYRGQGHLEVVAPDAPLGADVVRWTQDRFAGIAPADGCETQSR